MKEAETCVGELNVPHFHHELVKRAVTTALDKGPDDRAAMASLLAYLHAEGVSAIDTDRQRAQSGNLPSLSITTGTVPLASAASCASMSCLTPSLHCACA